MFVTVYLLNNFKKPLTYAVPKELQSKIFKGSLVEVPLRNYTVSAFVENLFFLNKSEFKIRDILAVVEMPEDKNYIPFLHKVGYYYQVDFLFFLKRMKTFLFQQEKKERKKNEEKIEDPKSITFTAEQQQVYHGLNEIVSAGGFSASVLHGVTGSGKTEIYNRLIQDVLTKQQVILFLVPEVTLALHFEAVLQRAHGRDVVFGFHSGSSIPHKRELWKKLQQSQSIIIVGVHLPVFLPISKLGLIIVDEEHDSGFQEKKHPKIHTRDMAILRAQMHEVPILLGSATPSMSTLWNVKKRAWNFFAMKQRFGGVFPEIKLVSLQQKYKRKQFWITPELDKAITDQLRKKEQTILFLNRRGMNFFVQCLCGEIFSCSSCAVSLTVHFGDNLICHYCGYHQKIPKNCTSCGVEESDFIKKGIGTQRLVSIVQQMYPEARVARLDLDTIAKKKQGESIVEKMNSRQIDILIGTQSVTKGYHFPGVTLVGIIWADLNMHFPVYNAVETTIQQLIQVAGRAGRQSLSSKVIIQSFDTHEAFKYLNEENYLEFYEYEIKNRTKTEYPPVGHLVDLEMRNVDEKMVDGEAEQLVNKLQKTIDSENLEVIVLGPVPPVVSKIKAVHIRKIYLKGKDRMLMIKLFASISRTDFDSEIAFTTNSVS